MKKKVWGNAVWLLFNTLAQKLKDEYASELIILFTHISSICNNLPCPDCQQHASRVMMQVNRANVTSSKQAMIDFLWNFHNSVNIRTKTALFPKESLNVYTRANTFNIVKQCKVILNIEIVL